MRHRKFLTLRSGDTAVSYSISGRISQRAIAPKAKGWPAGANSVPEKEVEETTKDLFSEGMVIEESKNVSDNAAIPKISLK